MFPGFDLVALNAACALVQQGGGGSDNTLENYARFLGGDVFNVGNDNNNGNDGSNNGNSNNNNNVDGGLTAIPVRAEPLRIKLSTAKAAAAPSKARAVCACGLWSHRAAAMQGAHAVIAQEESGRQ